MPPLPDLNTYNVKPSLGFPGQVADLSSSDVESRINESATPLDYGVAVARGVATTPGHAGKCKPVADGDQVVGISVKNPLETVASGDGANTVNFPRYSMVPVLKSGRIWVTAIEDVREGDAVLALVASGGGLASPAGGVAGTGRLLVPGAVWETTSVAGAIGLVYIKGGETGRLTT